MEEEKKDIHDNNSDSNEPAQNLKIIVLLDKMKSLTKILHQKSKK